MEALAEERAASSGLAFVRPTLEAWAAYDVTRGLQRVQVETPSLTDEESAELEAENEALVAQLEDVKTEDEAREAAETRVREIGARITAISEKPPLIPEEVKPRSAPSLCLMRRVGRGSKPATSSSRAVSRRRPARPTDRSAPARWSLRLRRRSLRRSRTRCPRRSPKSSRSSGSRRFWVPSCIAVVDAGGNLLAFTRQDGALIGCIDLAINKARTARLFDKATGDLGRMTQPGAGCTGSSTVIAAVSF
jgi:hypothetical protein